TSGWQRLPPRRIDLTGEIEEPFTIQWAGDLSAIRQDLLSKGWRLPAPWASSRILGWLSAKTTPVELPVTPHLASGRLPSLTLVLQNGAAPNNTRFVLRLWDADLNLMGEKLAPVWIGSVVQEQIERPLSLYSAVSTQADANTPRDILAQMLGSGRIAVRPDAEANTDWDGGVLLLRTGF
ncbi:MAG: LssY C-terminal domain-containing protein, partial [Mesorhizobium sp.]